MNPLVKSTSFFDWLEQKRKDVKQHITDETDKGVKAELIEFYTNLIITQARLRTESHDDALIRMMRVVYCKHCGEIGSNPAIGVQ